MCKVQRPPSDSAPPVQKTSDAMDRSLLPHPVSINTIKNSNHNSNDRCEQIRLGGNMSSICDVRALAHGPKTPFNELFRIKSHPKHNTAFCKNIKRENSNTTDRQYDSSSLYKEAGNLKIPEPPLPNYTDSIKMQELQNKSSPQVPPRPSERVGRLGLSVQSNSWRMGPGCKHVQTPMEEPWSVSSRPVLKSIQCSIRDVHLPLPRPFSRRGECTLPGLQPVGLPVRLPSYKSPPSSGPETSSFQGPGRPDCSVPSDLNMVPQPHDPLSSPLPPFPHPFAYPRR